MDADRLEQFANTKRAYDKFPQKKEFLIPTRKEFQVGRFLDDNDLMKDVRLFPYSYEPGFNPAMAFNIGVRHAKYDHLIITSPEVLPMTDVLGQLETKLGKNVICQVFDENEEGGISVTLVCSTFRADSPAMYFLAMFNKKDIEAINGWDEEFMKGYGYEDNDFGERWKRAELPYEFCDEIKARHQYHPRIETIPNGVSINSAKYNDNNAKGVIKCENGLSKL